MVHYVLKNPLPPGTFLNVNFPSKSLGPIRGICLTRQGKEFFIENPEERQHPGEETQYYWLGAKLLEFSEDEDSDILWLKKGYATAVPIHISELTHLEHFQSQKKFFETFMNAPQEDPVNTF